MCGNFQVPTTLSMTSVHPVCHPKVGNYIQPLWEAIKPMQEGSQVQVLSPMSTSHGQGELLNGGVEAVTTLTGAGLALLLRLVALRSNSTNHTLL